MSYKSLSFMFKVEMEGVYVGTPEPHLVRSALDAHGALLDLRRLPEEDGVSYWKRLSSVVPLRASSTTVGLIHGATRELGLEEKTALIITPTYASGRLIAPSPYVEVLANKIVLYSTYVSSASTLNVIDREIDIFNHSGAYTLSDVVSQIQQSAYFVAVLGTYVDGTEHSCGLIPTSSQGIVEKEWVRSSTYLRLANREIIPGTLTFSETGIFDKEITPVLASAPTEAVSIAFSVGSPVTARGQYYVDYTRGVVTSYSTPSGYGTCRYAYRSFPLRVRWSPIAVYSLRDPNYREELFESETMSDGSVHDGLVTAEGKAVYDQIFARARCLWGA